jgi:hypothetical protein
MNDFETKPSAPSPSPSPDVVAGLQTQVHFLLIAMILLSGIFATFVYIQARRTAADLAATKVMGEPILQAFAQEKTTVEAFLAKLLEYSKTHADIAPVLAKYPWFFQMQTSAPPVAATTPKPTAPVVTKPAAAPSAAPKK